jgi:hypothetical protein
MHERPRGFGGFRISPAAFLIDAVQNGRTLPDWSYAHEKQQRQEQWERERALSAEDDLELRRRYENERAAGVEVYLASPDGRRKYDQVYPSLLELYKLTEPLCSQEAAHSAALARIERLDFQFPDFAVWALTNRDYTTDRAA